MGDYTNRDYFYGRPVKAAPPKPDVEFEDQLIAEICDLRAEVETLQATIGMVREVLLTTSPRGDLVISRIIDALGEVGR